MTVSRIKQKSNAPESLGTSRDDKELLEGKLVSSVLSSVDNIETGDGKDIGGGVASNVSVVLPEWDALGGSSGLGGGKRDC